jgi:hypothetical protein
MNWKLLFALSSFALIMGFATILWIPAKVEPYFWVFIFLLSAYLIARNSYDYYFSQGFALCLINCVWITGIHYYCFNTYIISHPEMKAVSEHLHLSDHPRVVFLIAGPIAGIASGLVQGSIAFVAGQLVRKA